MFDMSSDLKSSIRNVLRAPGTSLTIVATLALAMAATTVGFSFADFAILRGMPVDDTSRVIDIRGVDPRQGNDRCAALTAKRLRHPRRATTLERVAAFQSGRATLIEHGGATSLDVIRATSDFFAAMGQKPALGRLFQDEDSRPARRPSSRWRITTGSRCSAAIRRWSAARSCSARRRTPSSASSDRRWRSAISAVVDLWIAIPFDADRRACRPHLQRRRPAEGRRGLRDRRRGARRDLRRPRARLSRREQGLAVAAAADQRGDGGADLLAGHRALHSGDDADHGDRLGQRRQSDPGACDRAAPRDGGAAGARRRPIPGGPAVGARRAAPVDRGRRLGAADRRAGSARHSRRRRRARLAADDDRCARSVVRRRRSCCSGRCCSRSRRRSSRSAAICAASCKRAVSA